MLIYFFLVLIIYFSLNVTREIGLVKKWNVMDIFVLSIMIAFAGFRYYVGTDYGGYLYIYNNVVSRVFSLSDYRSTNHEIGFYFLSWVTKNVSDSPYAIFWTSAIITYLPIYVRLKKDSNNFPFALLLYFLLGFYTFSFNGIRQSIAISISFYASRYMNINHKKFILINIIASLFHLSAFVAFIIQILVSNIKSLRKFLFISLFILLTFLFVWYKKPAFVMNFLYNINPKYLYYFTPKPTNIGVKLQIFLRFLTIVYVFLFTDRNVYTFYKFLLIISLIFLFLGLYMVFLARFEMYFSIYLTLLLPEAIRNISSKEDKILHQYILFAVFFIVFILSLLYYNEVIPYKTYLTM
jgi:hypothetical protein